ncbi:cell division control protein 14, SIN component-domain-containing protein [Cyathus striatus]|nr:cell division control protein 14, SIN component-domain-containing protein [Cyathus striatus]
MNDILLTMRNTIQDALDDLDSPRSSSNAKTRALESLERHLYLLVPPRTTRELWIASSPYSIPLNATVSHRVRHRPLLPWISLATVRLDQLTNKGAADQDFDPETCRLASQLSSSLSLIQGVALIHPPSKVFLGRKYPLEVLLDLLLVSRHLSNMPDPSPSISTSKNTSAAAALPLSSIALDTLLCVLVDSSDALRAFEDANGVQVIVKILKRAGTPREVRMKCLEFLYFYLLDETPSQEESHELPKDLQSTPAPAALSLPFPLAKPSVNATPVRPSRYGSGTSNYSFPSSLPSSGYTRSTRSASGSSSSSAASSSTAASSVASSPDKSQRSPNTPPNSPPPPHRPPPLQPRSMMMLRKEVDFVPLSPKKASISKLGPNGISRRTPSTLASQSRLGSSSESIADNYPVSTDAADKENTKRRTTDEKKELLGTMLGNVDALVEGVRKAGIWGLG